LALAAAGGAVWLREDDGRLKLRHQINMPVAKLLEDSTSETRHSLLLNKVLGDGQPMLVSPQSGTGDDEPGNPTDYLLVIGTLEFERHVHGIVEVFQQPRGGPTTQRGYLRFLAQMCELASEFLRNRRLRAYSEQQQLWNDLEHFVSAVHQSLETRRTVYTIVNEGRRILNCDRVSVAICRGRQFTVEAVSGLDSLDRRAEQVTLLGRLVTTVAQTRESVWYDDLRRELSPQIHKHLQPYVDQSHAKLIGIIPLTFHDQRSTTREDQTIGTLVIEQLQESRATDSLMEGSKVIAHHASSALANCLEHQNIFLMPVWRVLGRARWTVSARNLPKTLFATAALLTIVLALVLIPKRFELAAAGKLQPSIRREVFAPIDGVVEHIAVEHGDRVLEGQELVRLRNTDLDVEISRLLSQQITMREQIATKEQTLLRNSRLAAVEQDRLASELMQLKEYAASLDRQLALYKQKQQQLSIKSDRTGEVITWKVYERLDQRPVRQGQALLTIADRDGPWELELNVAERRIGYVAEAAKDSSEPLPVVFSLSTFPDQQFEGRVEEIHQLAEKVGEGDRVVRIRVAFNKSDVPQLHHGTTVQAKVVCGRRSSGFVIFHDLIEAVHSHVLFWL
jgi:multidrug efflux pump subunit AcrA (membrane-fusion protein)